MYFNTKPEDLADDLKLGDASIARPRRLEDARKLIERWQTEYRDHTPYHTGEAQIRILEPLQPSERSLP